MGSQTQRPVWLPFHVALGALIFLFVFFFCEQSVAEPDIWWHLNNAEKLLRTGQWPHADVYSFTVRGAAWVNHEWLSELPFYAAWRLFGLAGLYCAALVLLTAVGLGVLSLCHQATGNIKASFLATAFTLLLATVSFGPRTLLVGSLLMVGLIALLERFKAGHRRSLWAVPVLFCVWINAHPSWLIGVGVFGLYLATGLVKGEWGIIESAGWTRPQLRQLLAVAAASFAMLFVNPYGFGLVRYPFDFVGGQTLSVAFVEEWAPVDFHSARGRVVLVLLLGILLSALVSRQRWRLHEVALTLLGLYAGLTHVRFLFLAAIFVSPLLARRLSFVPPYSRATDKPWLNALAVCLALGIAVVRFPTNASLEQDLADHYPAGAVQFMRERGIRDHLFNQYSWGGYLQRFYPEAPVFIDSRADVFEREGVLRDYLDVTQGRDSLAVLERNGIQYVLMSPNHTVYLLEQTGRWGVLYRDATSVLLARR